MNTLAFDTCFGACSVAVTWSREGRLPDGLGAPLMASRFAVLERGHAECLMPMIADAMDEAPFTFAELERIWVTTGPGTFTGQRVGIAAARALSLATGASVGTLSSLAVMAHTAKASLGHESDGRALAVAVDARRGEIYFQTFAGPTLVPLGESALLQPEDALALITGHEAIVVGSGAVLVADASRGAGADVTARLATLQPDVRFIPSSAVTASASQPRPLYLRPPDAKPQGGSQLTRVS